MNNLVMHQSNSHYFWKAAYLNDKPQYSRGYLIQKGLRLFDKHKGCHLRTISPDDLQLYFYHLPDEALQRLILNIQHFAPLSGNPHDLLFHEVLKVKINHDTY